MISTDPCIQIRPWRLSCSETLMHFIPVIGMFTAAVAWHRTKNLLESNSIKRVSADYIYAFISDEPDNKTIYISDETTKQIQTKKANRVASFVINSILSVTALSLLFFAHRKWL